MGDIGSGEGSWGGAGRRGSGRRWRCQAGRAVASAGHKPAGAPRRRRAARRSRARDRHRAAGRGLPARAQRPFPAVSGCEPDGGPNFPANSRARTHGTPGVRLRMVRPGDPA